MMPLVSVCMTTYNHEAYISQAIESVLAQHTDFGVEIVIGEDCSTDSTLEICRQYEQQYPDVVRVVTSPQNVGMHANYRRTIEACRGEYIAMLDGDDYFSDSNKLQMQVGAIEEAGAAMCYTRSERKSQTKSTIYPQGKLHESFADMLVLNTAENCTTLARRDMILRYYDEVKPHLYNWQTDDLPMWLWFAATQKICAIDCVTAVHRVLDTSVSHSTDWQKRISFCDSLADIMVWFDAHYGESKMNRFLLRRKFHTALWVLSYHGTVGQYLHRWWRAVCQKPCFVVDLVPYVLFAKKVFYRLWR